ncbi:MAG: DinB family protein [Phycisphaerales bacterium]
MPQDPTIKIILDLTSMNLMWIRHAVEDVPDQRMTDQPGTIVNHPAWTLAHLGAYAGLVLMLLDENVPCVDAEHEQFGYGTTPVNNPAAYPSKAELLARLTDRHARLAAIIPARHADYFQRPTPDKYRPFTPTIGLLAVNLLTNHEAYHLGQLKQWRRAARMPAN